MIIHENQLYIFFSILENIIQWKRWQKTDRFRENHIKWVNGMIIRSSTVPLGLCCHSSLSLNLSPWLQKLKRLNTYEATLSQVHKLAMPIFCVISLSRVSIFLVGRILLGILYTFNWHRCFDCYIHTLFKSKGAFTPLLQYNQIS